MGLLAALSKRWVAVALRISCWQCGPSFLKPGSFFSVSAVACSEFWSRVSLILVGCERCVCLLTHVGFEGYL